MTAENPRKMKPREVQVPRCSRMLLRWFTAYSERYIRRQFHAVRILEPKPYPAEDSGSVVAYANHAGWWDPLLALMLTRHFWPGRVPSAPIDAAMLQRYRFFARLGFFGVEQGTSRGAATFIRVSRAILDQPQGLLWVTPQGRFADVRERPPRFQAGLGHLAAKVEGVSFQPMAVEYAFWEERQPEVLLAFGDPLGGGKNVAGLSSAEWTQRLEGALAAAQDRLATASLRRSVDDFSVLARGRAGVGGVYDVWRRLKARWRGETFQAAHGSK